MKKRYIAQQNSEQGETDLASALASISNPDEMRAFLRDLCTPAELEAMIDRWSVVPMLWQGVPYREIHDRTGVSVTTVGRVARFLTQGNSGYQALAQRLFGERGENVAHPAHHPQQN